MAQEFPDVPATDTLAASRLKLLNRDEALKSNNSGTSFPTTGLVVGMTCFRTDQNKTYQLKDTTPTWIEVSNISGAANKVANSDAVGGFAASQSAVANNVAVRNASGQVPGDITGNAQTAAALANSRTISVSGDATGSASFNGGANADINLTLATQGGVTPGTYNAANVTVDSKGRVTAISGNPSVVASLNGRSGAVSVVASDLTGLVIDNDWRLRGGSPTLHLRDTDHRVAFLHCNANLLYILSGAPDATTWTQVNGQWPAYFNLSDNSMVVGGNIQTGTYGWLHDYFFNAVSNCLREGFGAGNSGNCGPGQSNVINCYGGGNLMGLQRELVDSGGAIGLRTVQYFYNCNCNCDCAPPNCNCACDCSCVPAGTLVRMEDDSLRAIEDVRIGDRLCGGGTVLNLRSPYLGHRALWEINGRLQITGDHLIRTKDKEWACVEPELMPIREARGIAPAVKAQLLQVGDQILSGGKNAWEQVESIEHVSAPPTLRLFTLYVDGPGCFYAEDICIDGILTPDPEKLAAMEALSA